MNRCGVALSAEIAIEKAFFLRNICNESKLNVINEITFGDFSSGQIDFYFS